LGVSKDAGQAMVWYRKAADQGSAAGQFGVGLLYYEGSGVPRDVEEAKRWFTLAARQGDPRAIAALQELGGDVPAEGKAALLRDAAMNAPAVDLAQGYAFTLMMEKMLQLVGPGSTVQVGGQAVNEGDLAQAKDELAGKQVIYVAAIRERGFRNIAGKYRQNSTSSCSRAQSLWASALGEPGLHHVEMQQEGFVVTLRQVTSAGPRTALDCAAVVVESSLAFADPGNSDYYWNGAVEPGRIVLRPRADSVLASWPPWAHPPARKDLEDCVVTLTAIE